jgi:hypothetical protein
MWWTGRHWRYPPPPRQTNSWRTILIRMMWVGLVVAAFLIILSMVVN